MFILLVEFNMSTVTFFMITAIYVLGIDCFVCTALGSVSFKTGSCYNLWLSYAHYEYQAGFKLTEPPASPSLLLKLKVCFTVPKNNSTCKTCYRATGKHTQNQLISLFSSLSLSTFQFNHKPPSPVFSQCVNAVSMIMCTHICLCNRLGIIFYSTHYVYRCVYIHYHKSNMLLLVWKSKWIIFTRSNLPTPQFISADKIFADYKI